MSRAQSGEVDLQLDGLAPRSNGGHKMRSKYAVETGAVPCNPTSAGSFEPEVCPTTGGTLQRYRTRSRESGGKTRLNGTDAITPSAPAAPMQKQVDLPLNRLGAPLRYWALVWTAIDLFEQQLRRDGVHTRGVFGDLTGSAGACRPNADSFEEIVIAEFALPLHVNDGTPLAACDLAEFFLDVHRVFGGATCALDFGFVRGVSTDVDVALWVTLWTSDLASVQRVVSKWVRRLDQDEITILVAHRDVVRIRSGQAPRAGRDGVIPTAATIATIERKES